jgi:hypothetical protein
MQNRENLSSSDEDLAEDTVAVNDPNLDVYKFNCTLGLKNVCRLEDSDPIDARVWRRLKN